MVVDTWIHGRDVVITGKSQGTGSIAENCLVGPECLQDKAIYGSTQIVLKETENNYINSFTFLPPSPFSVNIFLFIPQPHKMKTFLEGNRICRIYWTYTSYSWKNKYI
jgi:hypothetical protein